MRSSTQASPGSQEPPAGRSSRRGVLLLAALLFVIVGFLFRDSFRPEMAAFANDGPLGAMAAACFQLPGAWKGIWADLNWLGGTGGVAPVDFTWILNWLLGPLYFIKFYPGITVITLGLAAWVFFRQLGFAPAVCILGGLAAALNSDFFSYACWGLGTLPLCVASVFLALAALVSRIQPAWAKPILAGAALGSALMEGFDNGAIFSLYVAAFAMFHAWNSPGTAETGRRISLGLIQTAVVAVASALVASHMLIGLVQGNITGVTGMGQDKESTAARWQFATQWSLPPRETLRAIIPGLYGYRMDTPDGGQYWGTVGSDPSWDAYFAQRSRSPESAPRAMLRFSGAGHYTGVLVILLAAFGVVQSLRREKGPLSPTERRWVWFWAAVALVSLLFAFGRFAPFYRIIYALPYFNTIRNPVKFLHPLNTALVVLCAYGLQALWRGWIEKNPARAGGLTESFRSWWATAPTPDRRWVTGTFVLCLASLLAWLIYGSARASLVHYLAEVGFPGPDGEAIARFSHREVGLFVLFFASSSALLVALLCGWLSGSRARFAALAVGTLLTLDLARANAPWIIHYDWRERFTTNPLFDTLRASPHTARVTGQLPFGLPGKAGEVLRSLASVYGAEWIQHQFRYFNIQSLDIVQQPRTPADFAAYAGALETKPVRKWELTNTRFMITLAPLVDAINQSLDPELKRFRLHTAFDLAQTPSGVITVTTNTSGPFGLVEFTGAMPRAMLFDNWRPNVPDDEALSLLSSTNFSPYSQLLIADAVPAPSVNTSTQPAGTATYESYSSRNVVIATEARTPCILLLNDKHDPDWNVLVDGKPEPLLRANFIMRGVYLTPGKHRVEFRFEPSRNSLWFSCAAIAASLALLAYTGFAGSRSTSAGPR